MSSSRQTQGETTMRLARANLDRLPPTIRRPAYDRSRVTPGIVHLGLGAFHRAHQAVVIDDCLAAGAVIGSWGIVGASLRSPETRDALAPQDRLYTVAVRAAEGTEHRVIGAMLDSSSRAKTRQRLLARDGRSRHAHRLAHRHREGLLPHAATGDLDERHPDIVHDLDNPDAPRSAPGFIVAALARRRRAGAFALHRAVLRQPRRQRPHRAADRDAVRGAAVDGPRQMDRGRRSPSPRRWSTASCRRRPMPTAMRSPPRSG